MSKFVKKIEVTGIHERFNFQQKFQPGINILYGINGTGKTTLLHVLANILNGDFIRFLHLNFFCIQVWLNDDSFVKIIREDDKTINILRNDERWGKKISAQDSYVDLVMTDSIQEQPLMPAAYFPAFRNMIEAWASVEEKSRIRESINREVPDLQIPSANIWQIQTTRFARKLFGQFIPQLNYPSPIEIEQRLSDEIRETIITVSRVDREVLSQSFVDIFAALSSAESTADLETAKVILEQIKLLSEEIQNYPLQEDSMSATGVYAKLRQMLRSIQFDNTDSIDSRQIVGVLSVYRDSLKKIVDTLKSSFTEIERYLSAVNDFLEGKKLDYAEDTKSLSSLIKIRFDDGSSFNGLSALSSGERQIVTLIYAATHMSQQNLVLIDEPEISLHVDWQRLLLKEMSEQLPNKQIIVCTHSPMIAADYEDRLMELKLTPTDKNLWDYSLPTDKNEIEYLEDDSQDEDKLENFEIDLIDE